MIFLSIKSALHFLDKGPACLMLIDRAKSGWGIGFNCSSPWVYEQQLLSFLSSVISRPILSSAMSLLSSGSITAMTGNSKLTSLTYFAEFGKSESVLIGGVIGVFVLIGIGNAEIIGGVNFSGLGVMVKF